MGNTSSSSRTPGMAATIHGNVQNNNISNMSGGTIITASRDVNQTIINNFSEPSANIGKYKMWLDPPDPSINYNSALCKHHHDTGNWLLGHPIYENWKTMSNSVLWLYGLSGSGKTVLCSMIIENVQRIVGEGVIGLAYYYFDIFDVKKRTVEGLLSSLALRLYACNPSNQMTVDQLYRNCKDGIDKPSGQQLKDLLKELISGFKETYIVIDALDECGEWQELLELLNMIHGWHIDQCHLLVTSRKEQVIVNLLQVVAPEEIDLTLMPVDSDINRYIDEKFAKSVELQRLKAETREEIKGLLKTKANGMFRWVACQIVALENCSDNMGSLKRTLEMLPVDLETTYDQILGRIHPADAKHAMMLLYWLVFAIEPLKLEELAIIVQINVEKNTLDAEEKLTSPKEILKICSSLVALSEDGTAKLAHASVKEYFLDKPRRIGRYTIDPRDGDLLMTKWCLAYLHQSREAKDEYWQNWTLPGYCARLWPKHILAYKNETAVKNQILTVCNTKNIAFKNWKAWRKFGHEYISPETPLEHVVVSGLFETVKWLLTKTNILHAKVLLLACKIDIVELLLDKGANVNAQAGRYGNALQVASSKGVKDIVELLLDKGANVNAKGGFYGNALFAAISKGAKGIVEILLDKGADVNAWDSRYGNALFAAISKGDKNIVELLLDKGANMNTQGGRYGNALYAAISKGDKDIVELLLDKSADVNAQDGEYGNALLAAISKGAKDIVKLLLDKGADVNAQGGFYGHALQAASFKGAKDIVELLLDQGADVNAKGGFYGNALSAAISKGAKDIVELLLNKGADVNAQGDRSYDNIFQAAPLEGVRV